MMHGNNKTVTVNRVALIAKLKENQIQHRIDFNESVAGYAIKLEEDLTAALLAVRSLAPADLNAVKPVQFQFPTNYEKQYADAIEMMEWSVGEVIELDQTTFKAYVQNEWSWTQSFSASSTFYKSVLAGAVGG